MRNYYIGVLLLSLSLAACGGSGGGGGGGPSSPPTTAPDDIPTVLEDSGSLDTANITLVGVGTKTYTEAVAGTHGSGRDPFICAKLENGVTTIRFYDTYGANNPFGFNTWEDFIVLRFTGSGVGTFSVTGNIGITSGTSAAEGGSAWDGMHTTSCSSGVGSGTVTISSYGADGAAIVASAYSLTAYYEGSLFSNNCTGSAKTFTGTFSATRFDSGC